MSGAHFYMKGILMIRQLETTVVNVTRELALDFATMPAWKGERPLRQDRVDMLTAKISDGLFHSPTWALARLGALSYRINGQHSSHALAKCGNIPAGLQATILEFEVNSERELADLFGQFDNPVSTRRLREVIHAHAAVDEKLATCPINTLQVILSGVTQALGEGQVTCSIEQKASLMFSHGRFIEFARRYANRRTLMYQAVIAAMYLTWKRDEERAEQFWNLVLAEDHPDSNNATRALARFLNGEVAGRSHRGLRWDRRAIMVKCLHAWNAYWRSHSTSLKYVQDAPIPTAI